METEPVPRTKFKSYSADPHLLLGIKGYLSQKSLNMVF